MREMVPDPSHNIVVVCHQIILYYVSSRLVTLLKVIDVHMQIFFIIYFTVCFKFIYFSCHIFLLLVPELSTRFMSYTVKFIHIALVWIL